MKKFAILSVLFSSLLITQISSADTIAQWTFEINTPADLANSTTISGIAADVGTGTAAAFHADAATDWTTPAGNGSTNSLSANTWTAGDYFQFTLSTLSYQDIMVSLDQTGSGTGPGIFGLFYSVNGGSYTQFGADYNLLVSSWNPTTYNSAFTFNFDLSSVTVLDEAATVAFRVVDINTTSINGGTVAAGGTGRIDNFTVTATPVPEPTSAALLGGFGVLAFFLAARRRRS